MPAATAATPAPAAPAGTPPAPTNPEMKKTINVVPQPVEGASPPKPGSARERMFKDLEKRAKPGTGQPTPAEEPTPSGSTPAAPPAGATPPVDPKGTTPPSDTPPGKTPADTAKTPEGTQPASPGEKTSPWKLVDRYKARVGELEKQLSERTALPEQERTQYLDRIKKAEERNTELENEIRFVNYKKSAEFKSKYDEPYQRAWAAAMNELKELTVPDGSGGARPMQFDDILQLVNLPLPKARELAEQMFGGFADDVMAHRKTLRQLWDAQAAALDDAYKNGSAREKERTEKAQHESQTVQKFVSDKWNETNQSVLKDERYGKFFSPVEGDSEGNARLTKGFALVDQAFKENPLAPGLTEEQRLAIVKRHAAVRNRAAAFGSLVHRIEQRDARIAELEKELAAIKGSVPPIGGDTPSSAGAQPSSAKEAIRAGLQKYAKTV